MYNTLEALAVAVAAYEYNDNSYLKENKYEYDYEQDTNNSLLKSVKWSNKEILREYFNIDAYSKNSTAIDRPLLLKITDDHRNKAEEIRKFTKKLLFKALAYSPTSEHSFPPYDISIFQKVNQEEIKLNDFGFIASAPYFYDRESYRADVEQRMENSQHVGTITGRVYLNDLEVTRVIWSNNYQTNIVQGLCDSNLFFFFTNVSLNPKEKIELSGVVKDHVLEKDKYPMTRLKYVKIKGRENAPETNITQANVFSDLL